MSVNRHRATVAKHAQMLGMGGEEDHMGTEGDEPVPTKSSVCIFLLLCKSSIVPDRSSLTLLLWSLGTAWQGEADCGGARL